MVHTFTFVYSKKEEKDVFSFKKENHIYSGVWIEFEEMDKT